MKRGLWTLAGAALLVLILAAVAYATGETGGIPPDGWAALKSLGWPGAFLGAAFSPVGKAIAGLIQAMTPATSVAKAHTESSVVAEALAELAAAVTRQNEVNAQTVEALQQIQQGLAILLDRTQRQVIA